MTAVAATYEVAGGTFRVTSRERLWESEDRLARPQGLADTFMLTPDGQSVLALRPVEEADGQEGEDAPFQLVLVQNWVEELRQVLGR